MKQKPWSNTVNGQKAMFYRMERSDYEQMTRPLLPITIEDHIAQIIGKWPLRPIHLPVASVPTDAPLEDAAIAVAAYYSTQVAPGVDSYDILTLCRKCIHLANEYYLPNAKITGPSGSGASPC
jgi:hypothetical protein